ncbi:RNA-binding protein [Variovorax sp.]|uniref:RNA-binding protein n=1 Tax=Variovorax sp. TaxID=1871043 RepID=UPI002D3B5E10|nr:RNA-binding protein [Variovorax sp.]HYP85612.1 RNA-binding protein [Variovorax sp.]
MTRLLLGNIEPGTSDDEVRQFLGKYGFPEPSGLDPMPGDGSQPALLLHFDNLSPEALHLLRERIHGMFWHHRRLSADIMMDSHG